MVAELPEPDMAADSPWSELPRSELPPSELARSEGGRVEDAKRHLLELISTGALRPGDRLGTERELAAQLSVSRSTLRQALAGLAQAGAVRRVPGRAGGTFVTSAKVDRDLSVIVGLPEYLRRQGFVAGTQVLSATMAGADDAAAEHLALTPGSLVVDISRIRLADGVPISLERVRLPAEIFPGLLELPLGGSIYELLDQRYGVRPEDVIEHLEVIDAGPEEACWASASARRCSRSPGPPARPTVSPSSSPKTCFAQTGPGLRSGQRPNERRSSGARSLRSHR